METTKLRNFLEIPYDGLEEINLEAKRERLERVDPGQIEEKRRKYLSDERRIKAVTVCFSDLEGRFHMLEYDKKFLLRAADNLTFDGSSIRGFADISESDLQLSVDWPSFYWLPADIFGPGKVIVFGEVRSQDGSPYPPDFRSRAFDSTDHDGCSGSSRCRYVSPVPCAVPTGYKENSTPRTATPSASGCSMRAIV